MSKDQARSPRSCENEELLLAMLPELLVRDTKMPRSISDSMT